MIVVTSEQEALILIIMDTLVMGHVMWGNCKDILIAAVSSQALRSFKVTMSVDPKFHPKIIGRKGAVISQIRKDHDVSIQFPDKGDEQQVCVLGGGSFNLI